MNLNRLVYIIAFLCIGLMFGCSQPKTNTANDILDGTITTWNVDTPNPLLAYVPEDSAVVIATQRKRDIHSNGVVEYLDVLKYIFRRELNDELEELLEYYEAKAPEWGLDPNGRVDAVAYLHDNRVIMHFTLADEVKAAEAFNKMLVKEEEEEEDEDDGGCGCGGCGSYRSEPDWEVRSEKNWKIYYTGDPDDPEEAVSLGMHVQNGVLTVVFVNSDLSTADLSIFDDVMKVQQNRFVPKTMNSDSVITGYINYEKFIGSLLSFPEIIYEIDEKTARDIVWKSRYEENLDYDRNNPTEWLKTNGYSSITDDVCIQEFKYMVSDLTATNGVFTLSENGAGGIKFETGLGNEFLADIKSLLTEHAVMGDSDVNVKGYLSFSLDKTIKLIQRKALSQYDWKCTAAKQFVEEAIDEFELDELNDEDVVAMKDFESLSFYIKNVIIPDSDDAPIHFMGHMKYSPTAFRKLSYKVFDIDRDDYEEGKILSTEFDRHHPYKVLFKGNDAYFGSIPFSEDPKFDREKTDFADLTVKKGFLVSLLKKSGVSLSLLWSYHLNFKVEGNSLVFSILPMDE